MGEFNRFESEESADVREYSKEQHQDERDETAAEIRDKRSGYFDRQKETSSQVSETEMLANEKQHNIEMTTAKIEELEEYLDQKSEKLYMRLLHFFDLKRKRQELGVTQSSQEELLREAGQINSVLEDLNSQKNDRSELDEARKTLDSFYSGQSEQWKEYMEDEKARDVQNICREYGCFMVHAISPDFTPGNNSLLYKGTSWKDKLKVLLALEPTISASTIQPGDNDQNLWSRMGLIVSKGKVTYAENRDAGTQALNIKERADNSKLLGFQPDNARDMISGAISGRQKNAYNEMVIRDPKIAGFFVCLDKFKGIDDDLGKVQRPISEIMPVLQDLKMPLYALKNGRAYEFIEQNDGSLDVGEEIDLDTLLNSQYDVNGRRDDLLEDVFANNVLKAEKLAAQELNLFKSFKFGKQEFVEIFGREFVKSQETNARQSSSYRRLPVESGMLIEEGTEVIFLPEVMNNEKMEYFILPGRKELFRRDVRPEGAVVELAPPLNEQDNTGFVTVGGSWRKRFRLEGHAITDYESYLTFMDHVLANERGIKEERQQKAEQDGDDLERWGQHHEDGLKELSYHLYGFAEMAKACGRADLEQKALELAQTGVSYDDFRKLIEQRLDKNGKFRLTKADVGVSTI